MTHRPASMPSRAAVGVACLLLLGVAIGCAPAGSTVAPSADGAIATGAASETGAAGFATSPTPVSTSPSPAASSAATPSQPPRPAGTLSWPTTFDVELEQATYFSSPPFAIPFTIEVDEPGWFSGHLHADFFDLLRFDGVDHDGLPTRMVAFGDPRHIRGADGEDVPVDALTPAEAAQLLADAEFLTVSDPEEIELLGLEGVSVDITSTVPNSPVFGGPDGNFGLSPLMPVRMAILDGDAGFLLVLVLAQPDDVEAAWDDVQGLLRSIDLAP